MNIYEAKRRWEEVLLRQPGVVAIGVADGYIVVYVKERTSAVEAGIPKIIEGFPVKIVEIGEVKTFLSTTDRWRPAPAGVSIGHPAVSAGTFGGFVVKNGKIYGVSNNHVIALRWGSKRVGKRGDPVLQPGPYDGGKYPTDVIGFLKDYVEVKSVGKNFMDFAVFEPIEGLVKEEILEIGEPIGAVKPSVGMRVKKFGRTTMLTHSVIEAVDVTAKVIGWGEAKFYNQIAIRQPFSAGGDSGSLILDENNRVVGLLFAGSPRITLANRADEIEKYTGYKFATWYPSKEFVKKLSSVVGTAIIGAVVSEVIRRLI